MNGKFSKKRPLKNGFKIFFDDAPVFVKKLQVIVLKMANMKQNFKC